jgi:hypothetical protein
MPPIERALIRSVPWLIGGLLASIPLLLVSTESDPTGPFLIHLVVLVIFGLGLSLSVVALANDDWFADMGWSVSRRLWASAIGIIVLVTGIVGLVTLASSAALRFDPSTQFLQLLSALDIAWVVAALVVGVRRRWNQLAAALGGLVIGVFCVWSIWRYIDAVGFGPSGEWIVSGQDLMTLVIPFDMAAAVVAVTMVAIGTRHVSQTIEQPSDQS